MPANARKDHVRILSAKGKSAPTTAGHAVSTIGLPRETKSTCGLVKRALVHSGDARRAGLHQDRRLPGC